MRLANTVSKTLPIVGRRAIGLYILVRKSSRLPGCIGVIHALKKDGPRES